MKVPITDEIQVIEICKSMGWTYDEYENTPLWFIEAVKIRHTAEAYFNEKQEKKLKRKF